MLSMTDYDSPVVNCQNILKLPECKNMSLIAGESGAHRRILWVHYIEEESYIRFVKGKELILTTGILLRSRDEYLNFINALNKKKISGIVINEQPNGGIPYYEDIVALGNQLELPIFSLPFYCRFEDISQSICHEIFLCEQQSYGKSDPFNNISGTNGIAGAMDTNLMLRRDDRASNMASLIATGRDIEYQELRLRFDSGKWELEERKTAEQKRLERIPTFLFELVNFIQERGSWQGTATELMAVLAEKEVSANAATKYIAHFYDEVLRPAHIIYRTKRTAAERLILLKSDDSCDGYDGERSTETAPSQPSLPSREQ